MDYTSVWGVNCHDLFWFFTNHHTQRIVVPGISEILTNQQSGESTQKLEPNNTSLNHCYMGIRICYRYLLIITWVYMGQSELAPTNAPVGRSVHRMGCVFSFGAGWGSSQSISFCCWPLYFFFLFFLVPGRFSWTWPHTYLPCSLSYRHKYCTNLLTQLP
jgi:hypothetical protein